MDWRDVRTLYLKELRSAFRERSIVVNSVLLPIFLYPALLWLGFTGVTFAQGLAEGFTSRVVLLDPPPEGAAHRALADSIGAHPDVDLRDAAGLEEALARLRDGELDAVVRLLAAEGEAARLSDNLRVEVRYDASVDRSRRALDRVEGVAAGYRERWIEREADRLGVSASERAQFRVERRDVASERDRGAQLLAQMIPIFVVVMVALGCFMPAIDTTAGERERSTWETTLTLAVPRSTVVTAKYLHVATLGILAGILNVGALMISIGAVMAPLMRDVGAEFAFSIPLLAAPVLMAGAAVLALFFAAAMMLLASFARTFKDGQAMVTPVYWLVFIPILMGDQSDRYLDPTLALVPILNVAQMMKDAIQGVFLWPLVAETLVVNLVLVALLLLLARQVLRFEDFLLGAHDGSLWTFLKDRFGGGKAARAAAAPGRDIR